MIDKLEKTDENYMMLALNQAQKALEADEVPIGALVTDNMGKILGVGYNQVEKRHQQIAHAEVIAISRACKKIGDWRLNNCTLYVTLEPCAMCMGLAGLSRLKRVVFGAPSKLFGYQVDMEWNQWLYKKGIEVRENVLAEKSAKILNTFFKKKRN